MTADEQQLIEKIKRGDRSAFRDVVERYRRRVYNLALELSGSHDDAEDLAQDVFVKAYHNIQAFNGTSKLTTWLHRITVNTYIDSTRANRMKTTELPDYFNEENESHTLSLTLNRDKNPELTTEGKFIQQHVQEALEKLTPREKSVFVLRHYNDLSNKSISETLNVTEGTVKTLLFRAVQKLQQHLSFYRPDLGLEANHE